MTRSYLLQSGNIAHYLHIKVCCRHCVDEGVMGRLCGAQGGEPAALRLTRSGIRLLQQIDDSRATEWDLDRGYTGAYAVQCWPA